MKTLSNYKTFSILFLYTFIFAGCSSSIKIELQGDSMEPNFANGQVFSIETVVSSELRRGDLVVFEFNDGRRYLKRLIGLPGVTIEIHSGQVFINDQLLIEAYDVRSPIYIFCCITLDEKEFFVLGDNRNLSNDSHTFGSIRGEQILGKAIPEK